MGTPPDIDTALAWRGRTVRDQDGTPRVGGASEPSDSGGEMIRSEEEVSVRKVARPAERVRLKKVIVEDEVTETCRSGAR